MTASVLPRPGEVLRVTRKASAQFGDPLDFRVIRVHDWLTYEGWAWLDGYQLDPSGEAVLRRSIFVRVAGLERTTPRNHGVRAAGRPRNERR